MSARRRTGPHTRHRAPRRVIGGLAVLGAAGAGLAMGVGNAATARSAHDSTTKLTIAANETSTHMDPANASAHYTFTTHDDQADPTFNQLLGVNDFGLVAGYFGSGNPAATHPNKGYVLVTFHGHSRFLNENFPGSAQTQVIGINNHGDTVGFWVDGAGNNFGFVRHNGTFTTVANPAAPTFNQLLGINDAGQAVGFYNDAAGNSHAYTYDTLRHTFTQITVPGAVSTQATGIDDNGDIVGFATDAAGNSHGFFLDDHRLITIQAPGSKMTQAFGVNDAEQVVGQYTDAAGATHGFVWRQGTLKTVDDPHGVGGTTINGINDHGELVGFYVDAAKNTDGFVALPR
jgi:probable HAF family extracellular repeat protein